MHCWRGASATLYAIETFSFGTAILYDIEKQSACIYMHIYIGTPNPDLLERKPNVVHTSGCNVLCMALGGFSSVGWINGIYKWPTVKGEKSLRPHFTLVSGIISVNLPKPWIIEEPHTQVTLKYPSPDSSCPQLPHYPITGAVDPPVAGCNKSCYFRPDSNQGRLPTTSIYLTIKAGMWEAICSFSGKPLHSFSSRNPRRQRFKVWILPWLIIV